MIDAELRQPGEVARELNISTSTLRRWAKEFNTYLSKKAGKPDATGAEAGAHRRYTEEDVQFLSRVKALLDKGFTYDQVVHSIERQGLGAGEETRRRDEAYPIVAADTDIEAAAVGPSLVVVADALRNINENQQALQNSLQVNRNLLGVLIQDNFNLKEENAKLRDRMLKLEKTMDQLRQEQEASPLNRAQQKGLQSRRGCLSTPTR